LSAPVPEGTGGEFGVREGKLGIGHPRRRRDILLKRQILDRTHDDGIWKKRELKKMRENTASTPLTDVDFKKEEDHQMKEKLSIQLTFNGQK
jgi:hypothetical protein